MMPFVLDLTREFEDLLRPICDYPSLLKAGEILCKWMHIVNSSPRKMSRAAVYDLTETMYEHNIAALAAGVKMLPKHHAATIFLF